MYGRGRVRDLLIDTYTVFVVLVRIFFNELDSFIVLIVFLIFLGGWSVMFWSIKIVFDVILMF